MADSIEQEYQDHDVSKIDIEVFGILSFDDTVGDQKIVDMSGEWFDLNGNLKLLGLLIRAKSQAEVAGQRYKVKLSSLTAGRSLSARMGTINFRRQV